MLFEILGFIGALVIGLSLGLIGAGGAILTVPVQVNGKMDDHKLHNPISLAIIGILIGIITGLVGAGGGFLIIPTLVFLAQLPMKSAIGTSLLVIAINSLTGFAGSLTHPEPISWPFMLLFIAFAVAGIISGSILSWKMDSKVLKPAFGWFLHVMGTSLLMKQFLNHDQLYKQSRHIR